MDWLLVCAAVGLTVSAIAGLWNAYQFSRIAPSPAKHGGLPAEGKIEGVVPSHLGGSTVRFEKTILFQTEPLPWLRSLRWLLSFWRRRTVLSSSTRGHAQSQHQHPQDPRP
jgi:hypothetical protein